MTPQELKGILGSGLLSFPLTDFDESGDFAPNKYSARLEWLDGFGATALFLAGGAGEFFSLASDEYASVIWCGVAACHGKVPAIAGAGGPTRFAIACAQEAERAGASGILLMPHYLTEATQEGLAAHVEAVCRNTKLGVILYNRGLGIFQPQTLARLVDRCQNLVGFKDGSGHIELIVSIRQRVGDRLAYLCGMPTAEVYAAGYKGLGIPVYSSAVFNFVPRTAIAFHNAVQSDDRATQERLLRDFYLPFVELRNRGAGYGVSLIKAGAKLVGHDAGPVRPPLSYPTPEECEMLAALICRAGSQD